VITSIGKHYAVTLDRDATSFLGLNLAHNADNTVTVTQPKLLTKLFAPHPTLRKEGSITAQPPTLHSPKTQIPTPHQQTHTRTSTSSACSYTSRRADQTSWRQYPSQGPRAPTQLTTI
jgi:hypothetical protein